MNMDVSDLVLLAIGGYLAVTALVRLMRNRRDALVQELTREAEEQQRRKKAEDKRNKKKADGAKRKAA
jgi:hypothetical protein